MKCYLFLRLNLDCLTELEGFAKSLFRQAIPTYSLICKRASYLNVQLSTTPSKKPIVVILDASGAKVSGEGEWKVKIHGKGRPRKWIKLHLAVDLETQEIVAELTTESHVADSKAVEPLLDAINRKVKTVIADGAYDRSYSREAIKKKKAKALIPPPKNAKYQKTNSERDQAIAAIRGLGGGLDGRSLWGKLSGYSRRSLVETAFSRVKRMLGERLFSKRFDKQRLENTIRCHLLNRMNPAF